jgi:hypothetical protein
MRLSARPFAKSDLVKMILRETLKYELDVKSEVEIKLLRAGLPN